MKTQYQIRNIGLGIAGLLCMGCQPQPERQELYVSSVVFPDTVSLEEKCRMAAHVIPSERQLAWQEMEFTCFICYESIRLRIRNGGRERKILSYFIPQNWMPVNGFVQRRKQV